MSAEDRFAGFMGKTLGGALDRKALENPDVQEALAGMKQGGAEGALHFFSKFVSLSISESEERGIKFWEDGVSLLTDESFNLTVMIGKRLKTAINTVHLP